MISNNSNNSNNSKGYKSLPFFKQTEIIYDFTVEFCQKYIPFGSRTKDQMVQGARSGKQNIAEGYLQKSMEGKLKLLNVARGSLEELLNDYQDFLRQKKLPLWEMGSEQAQAVRRLVYNRYNNYNNYKNYIASGETAANAMICLINQTNALLDQKLRWLEEKFIKEGGFRENLLKKRLTFRNCGKIITFIIFITIINFITATKPAAAANVNFTLTAWVNPTTSVASKSIIVKNNELRLVTDASGNLLCQIHNGTAWQTAATSASALSLSSWQFVSCSYDGINLRVYINGEQKGIQAMTENVANTSNVIWLCKDAGGTYGLFSGSLDDVKIYKTVRSASQIRLDYETGPPPVAHWKMDEKVSGNGQTLYDTSGTNNGTTYWGANASGMNCAKSGKYGSGCELDGVDDYVQVTDHSILDITAGLTVATWVKVAGSTGGGSQYIFRKASAPYYCQIDDTTGRLNCRVYDGITQPSIVGATNLIDNEWHHIAFVRDKTGENKLYLYVDGVQDATPVSDDAGTLVNGADLYIGRSSNAERWFYGLIDDVRIYNYARTQKQIMQDMLGGAGGSRPAPTGYVGYWDFNEGQGTVAFDKSNNNNDLTLSAASWTLNGKFGRAFDGADNKRVATPADDNDFDFPAASAFSASLWFKSDSASNPAATQYILSKHASGLGYAVYADTNGYFNFGIDDDTSSFPEDFAQAATDFYDNTWHHLIAVKTGVSKIEIYIDGVFKGSDVALSASGTLENAGKLILGDYNETDGTDEFLGDLDEVKIYPFALSPAEIKQEYNSAVSLQLSAISTDSSGNPSYSAERSFCVLGDTSTCNPPVAWWKMDEKADNTCSGGVNDVCDTSANSNDGAITGAVWKSAGECKQGACLSFDGVDDYVDRGAGPSTVNTVAFWVYPATTTEYPIDLNGTAYIWVNAGTVTAQGFTSPTIYVNGIVSSTLSANQWQYVAVTTGTSLNASDLDIGRIEGVGNHEGKIDDVRIYNYARSAAQIAWDYNRGKPKLHFKFDENNGATTYDYFKTKNGDLTGHAPDWTGAADQCKFNYCLDFTPANTDYVDVGDTGIGANLQAVSFWVYPDSVVSQNIIDFDNGTHKITTDGSGNLTANGWTSPIYYINGVQTRQCLVSTWQHIAITTATAFNPNDVDFGRVSANYFDGKLDEIKFYTYPLTATQVKQDYQGGAVRIGPGSGLP